MLPFWCGGGGGGWYIGGWLTTTPALAERSMELDLAPEPPLALLLVPPFGSPLTSPADGPLEEALPFFTVRV